MAGPSITTFRDMVDYAVSHLRGNAGGSGQQDVRYAIEEAYEELPRMHDWLYYKRLENINLVAPYSTGTVAFDLTGGTYEREVTLSDGVWPTWAAYGRLVVNNNSYLVAERKSNTVITLTAETAPASDISAGATFAIYRDGYTLPAEVASIIGNPVLDDGGELVKASPQDIMQLEQSSYTTGDPHRWAVMGDDTLFGSLKMITWPISSTAQQLQYLYKARGRPITVTGTSAAEFQGTVSVTAGSKTVTGSGTAFTSRMIGSFIRTGRDGTRVPTNRMGVDPYEEQKVVTAVASTTSLTVDTNFANNSSSVKYTVSDALDLPAHIVNAFRACVRYKLACIRDRAGIDRAHQVYMRELMRAKEMDVQSPLQSRGTSSGLHSGNWSTELGADVP